MPDLITTAPPDKPTRSKGPRQNVPRLRDGVMKRGQTWSYVIRVKDSGTGVSKPRWVGGFATEQAAKAARDQARVKAHHGRYIDRSTITVSIYLDDWIEAHAVEIKPKTLQDYRHLIDRHVRPHIGELRLQAVTPARITKLYRDLMTSGGQNGAGLSHRTVTYVHAVLRKAFRDAVVVEQLLPSNPSSAPSARARRPSSQGRSGIPLSSLHSWPPPGVTGCSPSITWPPIPAPAAVSC
jgi:integrase